MCFTGEPFWQHICRTQSFTRPICFECECNMKCHGSELLGKWSVFLTKLAVPHVWVCDSQSKQTVPAYEVNWICSACICTYVWPHDGYCLFSFSENKTLNSLNIPAHNRSEQLHIQELVGQAARLIKELVQGLSNYYTYRY